MQPESSLRMVDVRCSPIENPNFEQYFSKLGPDYFFGGFGRPSLYSSARRLSESSILRETGRCGKIASSQLEIDRLVLTALVACVAYNNILHFVRSRTHVTIRS